MNGPLVVAPGFLFVQDSARCDTEFNAMQREWYQDVLGQKRIAYTIVAVPLEQRVQQARTLLI